jgi:hypothetical protein
MPDLDATNGVIVISSWMYAVMQGPGVYLWRRGDEVLYVGQTSNFMGRLYSHNRIGRVEKMLPSDVVELIPTENSQDCGDLEQQLIRRHLPKYNISTQMLVRHKREIKCEMCGATFLQNRWWQKYCSIQCGNGRPLFPPSVS